MGRVGDLRDQLKKAKILSDKRARQLAHEERVRAKEIGRDAVEQEHAARRAELGHLQGEERAAQKAAQEVVDAAKREAAERAACTEILSRDAVQPRRGGNQRWHFQLGDGSLPWFEVDEGMAFKLQSGAFWVIRVGPPDSHDYRLLPAEFGERVGASLPDAVAWAPGRR